MFLLLLTGAAETGGTLTEQWVALLANDAIRGTFTVGMGALFSFVVWLLGMTPLAQKVPTGGRRFYPLIGGALGVVVGFFASAFIPGLRPLEMIGALTLGGGASHFVHKGAEATGVAERVRKKHSHPAPDDGPPYFP